MAVVKAYLDLRKELPNGIRCASFTYEFKHDGRMPTESPNSFNILTAYNELEVTWTIQCSYSLDIGRPDCYNLRWNRIKLLQCNKNIYGNYLIYNSKNGFFKRVFFVNANSPPYEHEISSSVRCEANSKLIITFDIHYEDERVPPLLNDYDKLYKSKNHSDITFVIGEEVIPAHKLIVTTHSDVFAAMFDSDMIENRTGRVEINDIESITFKQLLRFMYCGHVEPNDLDDLIKLIQAADKYSLKNLVEICADRLSCGLTVGNAINILIIADSVNSDSLKKNCIKLIIKYKQKIVSTDSYEKFRQCYPELALEIFDSIMGTKKRSNDHTSVSPDSRRKVKKSKYSEVIID